jgi:hypothetical protein
MPPRPVRPLLLSSRFLSFSAERRSPASAFSRSLGTPCFTVVKTSFSCSLIAPCICLRASFFALAEHLTFLLFSPLALSRSAALFPTSISTYSSVSSDLGTSLGFILPSFSWTHGQTLSPCYNQLVSSQMVRIETPV